MYVWHVARAADGRVVLVDGWDTLDAVIAEMAALSWEEPGNAWASYVTDDITGDAVAVALFGPGMELLVTVSDGRQLCFPMPEFYREGETSIEPCKAWP
jgi:hypothetical protein